MVDSCSAAKPQRFFLHKSVGSVCVCVCVWVFVGCRVMVCGCKYPTVSALQLSRKISFQPLKLFGATCPKAAILPRNDLHQTQN